MSCAINHTAEYVQIESDGCQWRMKEIQQRKPARLRVPLTHPLIASLRHWTWSVKSVCMANCQ